MLHVLLYVVHCCAILYILTKVSTVHVIIEFKGPLLLGWHHKNGENRVKDPFGSYKINQNSSHVGCVDNM